MIASDFLGAICITLYLIFAWEYATTLMPPTKSGSNWTRLFDKIFYVIFAIPIVIDNVFNNLNNLKNPKNSEEN